MAFIPIPSDDEVQIPSPTSILPPSLLQIICPSPNVATYDLNPEMSAYDVSKKFISEINERSFDFACLNFANPVFQIEVQNEN